MENACKYPAVVIPGTRQCQNLGKARRFSENAGRCGEGTGGIKGFMGNWVVVMAISGNKAKACLSHYEDTTN